ncbi:unnamed protein product [Mesocestoides corti]|uniref:PIPK domain-containing protein n=1 Tax=Mesocestoides corti TaxID=53468 RepID=A0A158QUY3_MESCO|nr:unnamed protein product [Mesocestoides corti]
MHFNFLDSKTTDPAGDPPRSPFKMKPSLRLGNRESDAKTNKKIGHRRVTDQGTVTYKKTPTSEIQRAIQLGIHHSIGTLQQKQVRDVLFRDFEVVETVDFPRSGTKTTPAHGLSDFRFRTFAPVAFRSFRDHFQLDIRDYLNSLCSQELRELSNPGASGSIFYISADDEFIIKTVQHKEANFLQKLLPEYYMNLVQHTRTLLPKFYGLHCYQCSGKNIRFVVMNNLLPSSVKMHERYDLKGSSYKRKANDRELAKASPTLKDLDFKERHPDGIWLEADTYDALMKTIERDCRVLESFRIMDYSLLLGVHNFDQAERDRVSTSMREFNSNRKKERSSDNGVIPEDGLSSSHAPNLRASSPPVAAGRKGGDVITASRRSVSPFNRSAFRTKLGNKRLTAFSTAMESIEAKVEPVEIEPTDPGKATLLGGLPARSASGDRLFLFIGIIDILQSYRMAKKMEHTLKSVVIDAETVSVTNPSFYARRFQNALGTCIFRKIPSLDPPQLFGPKAMRFRRLAHLGSLLVALSPSSETIASVTTWPRCHFLPGSSRFSSACSSGYSTMVNKCNWVTGGGQGYQSTEYTHSASVPLCLRRQSLSSEPYLFQSPRGELSWCAQSILSLRMDSDATSESDRSDSSSSFGDNFLLRPEDGTVMTTQGKKTVGELDSELAAVQKMVRRERARKQKEEAHKNHSTSNLQLSKSISVATTSIVPHYATVSGRRALHGGVPPPVDRRSRTPLARQRDGSPRIHKPPPPPMTVSVSTSALSDFMRNAESDFEENL